MRNSLLAVSLLCALCLMNLEVVGTDQTKDNVDYFCKIPGNAIDNLESRFKELSHSLPSKYVPDGSIIGERISIKILERSTNEEGADKKTISEAKKEAAAIVAAMGKKYCGKEESPNRAIIEELMNRVNEEGSNQELHDIAKCVGRVWKKPAATSTDDDDIGSGTLVQWPDMPPNLVGRVVITAAHNILDPDTLKNAVPAKENDYKYIAGCFNGANHAIITDLKEIPSLKKENKTIYFAPNNKSGFDVGGAGLEAGKVCFFSSKEAPGVEDYALLIFDNKIELVKPVVLDFGTHEGECLTVGLGGITVYNPTYPGNIANNAEHIMSESGCMAGFFSRYICGTFLRKATHHASLANIRAGEIIKEGKFGAGDSGSAIIVKKSPVEYKMVGVFGFPSRFMKDIEAQIQHAAIDIETYEIESQAADLQKQAKTLQDRAEKLASTLFEIRAIVFQTTASRIQTTASRIQTTDSRIQATDSRIQATAAAIQTGVLPVQDQTDAATLRDDLVKLRDDLAKLRDDLVKLRDDLAKLRNDVDNLDAEISAAETKKQANK